MKKVRTHLPARIDRVSLASPFILNGEVMKIFTAKNFSLFCTLFNTVAAYSCFNNGSNVLGFVCVAFACLCARNFLLAK